MEPFHFATDLWLHTDASLHSYVCAHKLATVWMEMMTGIKFDEITSKLQLKYDRDKMTAHGNLSAAKITIDI